MDMNDKFIYMYVKTQGKEEARRSMMGWRICVRASKKGVRDREIER